MAGRREDREPGRAAISRRGLLSRIAAFALPLAGTLALSRGSGARPAAPAPHGIAVEPWDERFECAVTFQFGDARSGMAARRPYLAIYVEDPGGRLVRTVILWAQANESWVRSLTRWYRADREPRGTTDLVATLTGATRPPGRYTVVWDGRDDDGRLVEQGEYFLCMETVRQGSRAYHTRNRFSFQATPFTVQLEDYGAFQDVSVEFRERG